MCVARNAGKESIGPVRNVLWDFGMMFQGFAIWVMGWIISLAFAFYLIDATIQLGIIGALMPPAGRLRQPATIRAKAGVSL